MKRRMGWAVAASLVALPAQAQWFLGQEFGVGAASDDLRLVSPGLEAAVGAQLSDGSTMGGLRVAAAAMAGPRVTGIVLGPELVLRHRFGADGANRPWLGVGAGLLFGFVQVTDMAMGGLFPRYAVEGGLSHPLADHRQLDLGLALRAYGQAGVVGASLVVGTGW